MPGGMETLVRAVLAHGADHDAVLHLDAADLERGEQLRHGLAVGLRRHGRSRRRLLRGGVVRSSLGALVVDVGLLLGFFVGALAVLGRDGRQVVVRVHALGAGEGGEHGGYLLLRNTSVNSDEESQKSDGVEQIDINEWRRL